MKAAASISYRLKRLLARIPSPDVSLRILMNTDRLPDGTLVLPDGKKVGHFDPETGIGWCSLLGYIRLCRAARHAA